MWKIRSAGTIIPVLFSFFFVCGMVARAQGESVIPHVPDGLGVDGTSIRTMFDITNLGPDPAMPVTKAKLSFFNKDGTPRVIPTNIGTSSEFPLNVGAFQTVRIETLGTGSLTAGYAILRNLENPTSFAEDYQLNISIYYEVKKFNEVIDTVTVVVGQPTIAWVNPAEVDTSKNLLTGLAIVNLSNSSNSVVFHLYKATNSPSGPAADTAIVTIILRPNEQRAIFLTDAVLFPNLTSFKGMLLGIAEKPVAILSLLQTPTPTGVQFATMVPAYADALRRNSNIYLKETFPLDADQPASDYYLNRSDAAPWDLLFEQTASGRQLTPQSGAQLAAIGNLSDSQFNSYTIEQLQGLTYSANPIDMGNTSANLIPGFTFGVKTGLGRYAKIRIVDVIQRDTSRDLALRVFVFR